MSDGNQRQRPPRANRASAHDDEDEFEARARLLVSEHAPDADLDSMAVMYNLLRTAARVVQDLETNVHRPFGLTWASFRVLFNVWVAEPISPRELARLSSVSRASISSVLNTLELRGLVVRRRTSPDRRVVEVELTEAGRLHMVRHWSHHNDREREWAAALDAKQRRALIDALKALIAHRLPAPRHQPAPAKSKTGKRSRIGG
jgi:MarR family transcriptional regulator, negative regulator of the multidrug operon emrRAB